MAARVKELTGGAPADTVFLMLAKGALTVEVKQRYSLEDAAQAHSDLETGRTTGWSLPPP